MNNTFKTALLLGTLTGLLLITGQLIGGAQGLTIAIIFSLLMNIGSWYWSDKIVLAMYRARPADKHHHKELLSIVRELATKAGLPQPRVYIIPSTTPNAFATGRNPKHASIAVTEGLLDILTREELKGVIAHELSHVKHRDILIATIAATIAGVISYVAMMARWAAIFGGFGGNDREEGHNILSLLVLAVIAPLLAVIIQLAISRSREYAADAGAAKIVGSGEGLARALIKLEHVNNHHPLRLGSETTASLFIVNPFKGRALANLFSTHPPTSERVKRLRRLQPA